MLPIPNIIFQAIPLSIFKVALPEGTFRDFINFLTKDYPIIGSWVEYIPEDESYSFLTLQFSEKRKLCFYGINCDYKGNTIRDFYGSDYYLVNKENRYFYYYDRRQFKGVHVDGDGRAFGIGYVEYLPTNFKKGEKYTTARGYFCDEHPLSTRFCYRAVKISKDIENKYKKERSKNNLNDRSDFIKWFAKIKSENNDFVLNDENRKFLYDNIIPKYAKNNINKI